LKNLTFVNLNPNILTDKLFKKNFVGCRAIVIYLIEFNIYFEPPYISLAPG